MRQPVIIILENLRVKKKGKSRMRNEKDDSSQLHGYFGRM